MTANRPDITIAAVNGHCPQIHPSAFIAPGCRIIGNVEIGADASIWYNCVVRADVNRVVIGARTNIQDGSVVHCDSPTDGNPDGYPTIIGSDVLIGHMAMIHGCSLEDRAFVGLGATVLNGCVIESDGMLAAGAMLTSGKRIETRQLWIGTPAKYVRDLDDASVASNQHGVQMYAENGRTHKQALGLPD